MANGNGGLQKARRFICAIVITVGVIGGPAPYTSSSAGAEETVETIAPDPTIVAVVEGPGGIGYWVVAADGSVEVIGTSIVPPLGEVEPITDRVRTAYTGAPGALGRW